METKNISLEEYQKHIKKSRQKVLKNKVKYIVNHQWKPIFEVIPIIHKEDPKEIDGALWEIK